MNRIHDVFYQKIFKLNWSIVFCVLRDTCHKLICIVGDFYVSGMQDAEVQNHCICEHTCTAILWSPHVTCKKNFHPCTKSCLKAVDNWCSQNKTTDINTVPDVLTFKSLWTTFFLWQLSTADAICTNFFLASFSGILPLATR